MSVMNSSATLPLTYHIISLALGREQSAREWKRHTPLVSVLICTVCQGVGRTNNWHCASFPTRHNRPVRGVCFDARVAPIEPMNSFKWICKANGRNWRLGRTPLTGFSTYSHVERYVDGKLYRIPRSGSSFLSVHASVFSKESFPELWIFLQSEFLCIDCFPVNLHLIYCDCILQYPIDW